MYRRLLFIYLCILLFPLSLLIHFLFAAPGLIDNQDDVDKEFIITNTARNDDTSSTNQQRHKPNATIIVAGGWRAPPQELLSTKHPKNLHKSSDHETNSGSLSLMKLFSGMISNIPPVFITSLPPDHDPLQIETLTKSFQLRLDKAVEVAVKYQIPRIIFTGAHFDAAVSRAYVMWKFGDEIVQEGKSMAEIAAQVRQLEKDEERTVIPRVALWFGNRKSFVDLIIETESRTTEQNAIFAKQVLMKELLLDDESQNRDEQKVTDGDHLRQHTIIVVTNPGHLRRTRMYFGREFILGGEDQKSENKLHFTLRMVGSDRDMFEWRSSRGLFLHPNDLPDAKGYYDFCFVPEKSNFAKFFRFLRDHLRIPEKGILDVVCCSMASFRHHQRRWGPAMRSIPFVFEIQEVFGIFVNLLQGKLSLREVYEFW